MEIKKVGVAGRGDSRIQGGAQSGYRTVAREQADRSGSWSDAARRDSAPQRERRHAHRSRLAVALNNLHGIAVANLADCALSRLYDLQNQEPRTKNRVPLGRPRTGCFPGYLGLVFLRVKNKGINTL